MLSYVAVDWDNERTKTLTSLAVADGFAKFLLIYDSKVNTLFGFYYKDWSLVADYHEMVCVLK